MRIGIALLTLLAMSILLISMMGCSGGGRSVIPPVDDFSDHGARGSVDVENSGHSVLMEGSIVLNPATGEVFNEPMRRPSDHVNVLTYVVPPDCWDCLTFPVVWITIPENPIKRDWHVKVKLKNPTSLSAYDVRATFFVESSGKLKNENWTNFVSIVNPDGYTRALGGGLYHPYINWIIGDFNTRDKFWGNDWSWTTTMVFRIPEPWNQTQLVYLHYKIDASFPGPIQESPGLLQEFVTNDGEWFVTNVDGYIRIPVWDWQANVDEVKVDLTPLNPVLGEVVAELDYSEYPTNGGTGPDGLHHYVAHVVHDGNPPVLDGEHILKITVSDQVSNFDLVDYTTVSVAHDFDPPVSCFDGGEYKGLIDLMNGDSKIRFYYDQGCDDSGVIYIFYHNYVQDAWDADTWIGKTDCNEILMNWPPNYPACYYELAWPNGEGEGRWWSVDAWDNPNNKAITTNQLWGQPVRPVERWHKLAGNIGQLNTNWGSTCMVDMDGDNDDDVIVANRMAKVFCYDGIGGGSPAGLKWTFDTDESAIYSSPAAADVTGDSIPEVFISTNGIEAGGVFAINGATGFELWSAVTEDIIDATVCLADIDGGGLDVVVGDNSGHFYAFNGLDGSEIWAEPFYTGGGGIGSSAAAGDVSGDEIPDFAFGAFDGHVYMVNGADGTMIWKYNCGTGLFSVQSSPAMYDANGDDIPDVVIGADETIYCFLGQGTGGGDTSLVWAQPLTANFSGSPAVGDTNFDGVPDVVVTGRAGAKDIYILDGGSGNGLYDWEVPGQADIFTPPILADVTADGHLNVIFGMFDQITPASTERYFVLNCDRLEYFVLLIEMQTTQIADQCKGMPNAPTLGDVDNNGKWDMSFGSYQGRVYVHNFDTTIPTDPALRPWTSFRGNDRRNGQAFEDH